ncbi:hypothetical protein SAMN04488581_2624 [Mycolicibacterium neoaurum]|uniref:hypothetical protein n=1 Tax=Mycolicibacterium neoaurum TaxID=1795 RepID=UPI000564ACF3|nr:hypothetical protein [Mycolicibacterium neoaurum]SDD59665.1 hypothetical protein SAMN04488581_2624 [Mycolicibacterium neoaurum]
MRLVDPKLEALRQKRFQAASDLEQVTDRLLKQRREITLYDNDEADADWPVSWPIPTAVAEAIQDAVDAMFRIEDAIAEAKRSYRRQVLEWLLAETLEQSPNS